MLVDVFWGVFGGPSFLTMTLESLTMTRRFPQANVERIGLSGRLNDATPGFCGQNFGPDPPPISCSIPVTLGDPLEPIH